MKWRREGETSMFRIDYNHTAAQKYADDMLDKVDDIIKDVLQPGFCIKKKIKNQQYDIVVEPHGFTKNFLDDYRKNTDLRNLLQADFNYLRTIVERVRLDSPENFVKLGKRKYDRCYARRQQFEDFHTIMSYIFVENGYEKSKFVDKETVVDSVGLKVCPYCGQSYIGSVRYPRSNGKIHVAKAQIDHFFPKGQYPFLALSYANFVPSCATCNQTHKHIEDVMDNHGRMRMMSPYNFDESKFRFGFGIKQAGWIDERNIEVKTLFDVKSADDLALMNGYKQILGIDKLYEFHNDIVLDVIYRKLIDLTAQYTYYHKGISIEKSFLDRYITAIYGYEPDPRNDRNRIRSKFLRDIVRQVDEVAKMARLN